MFSQFCQFFRTKTENFRDVPRFPPPHLWKPGVVGGLCRGLLSVVERIYSAPQTARTPARTAKRLRHKRVCPKPAATRGRLRTRQSSKHQSFLVTFQTLLYRPTDAAARSNRSVRSIRSDRSDIRRIRRFRPAPTQAAPAIAVVELIRQMVQLLAAAVDIWGVIP